MTAIDTKEYMTIIEAAKKIGCPRRSLYRIIDRVGVDKVCTMAFGKRLIHKSKLPMLRDSYYPMGTEKRLEALTAWGMTGGRPPAKARAAKRND